MPKRGRVRYNPKVYRRRVTQRVPREQPTKSLDVVNSADLDQAPIDLNDVDSNGIFEGILQKEMRFNEALEGGSSSGTTSKARLELTNAEGNESKKATNSKREVITDEENNQISFVKANEKHLKIFSKFRKPENSCAFLLKYPHLACEETANYLVDTCVSLEIEKKRIIGSFVAHQCVCIQYILELSKQLGVAPKEIIAFFFTRLQMPDSTYREAFEEELYLFKQRVVDHAKSKRVAYQHVEMVTMMDRCKNLSPKTRQRIKTLHDDGLSYSQISKEVKCSKSSCIRAVKLFNETGSFMDRPKSGRPRQTDIRDDRRIHRMSKANRHLTASDIRIKMMEQGMPGVSNRTIRRRLKTFDQFGRIV